MKRPLKQIPLIHFSKIISRFSPSIRFSLRMEFNPNLSGEKVIANMCTIHT